MRGAAGIDHGMVCGAIPTRGAGIAGLADQLFCAGNGVERGSALNVLRLGAFTFCHLPFPRNCSHCPLLRRKICMLVFAATAFCGIGLATGAGVPGPAPLPCAGSSCPGADPKPCIAFGAWAETCGSLPVIAR